MNNIDFSISSLPKKRRLSSCTAKQKVVDDPGDKVPLFLRKTYNMINACDISIASWSEDGLSFAVKDIDLFASRILCQYFKHKNFSSFVRQLNLYGFRKVKAIDNKTDLKYWEFKHDLFQRGRLDLLSQVRKSNQLSVSADKSEVEGLKTELEELRATISTMCAQMCGLSSLVNKLTKENQHPATSYDVTSISNTSAASKRKQDTMHAQQQNISLPSSTINTSFPTIMPSPCKKQRVLPALEETRFSSSVTGSINCSISVPESAVPAPTPLNDKLEILMTNGNQYIFAKEKAVEVMNDIDPLENELLSVFL